MEQRKSLVMDSPKQLKNVAVGDVVALIAKDGLILDFGLVKEVFADGFTVKSTQHSNVFFRFSGEAPGTKMFARPASEQESIIYRIRTAPAPAWMAIGMEGLKQIEVMLKKFTK